MIILKILLLLMQYINFSIIDIYEINEDNNKETSIDKLFLFSKGTL